VSQEILSAPRLALSRDTVEELSRQRQEPAWLLTFRLQAFETFERLPMPDQRTEGWRRTSLRGLDLNRLDVLSGSAAVSVRGDTDGLVVTLEDAVRDPRLASIVQQHLGQIAVPESDKFTALHYAFFNAGVAIVVPRGKAIEEPIWITYDFDQPGQSALVHTLVIAADESEVKLVEEFRGASHLGSGVVEQLVGANAHLRYVHLQRYSPDVWNFSWQRARLAQDASVRTLNVVVGGGTSRNTVQTVLEGRGGQADLLGIAETNDQQYVDFQTLQDHFGDATRSDLVIHNALRGRSSANFTGLIRINKSAHQTESSQEQKNILLSDRSKADSDPKLEILNNDVVRCTHGAAVGPVDQEMVFYLESRGLDRTTAERLIVEGFFQSVLKKVELPSLEEALWSVINERLSAE
jgi:Fe-S cluster assembly protein SufD